MGWGALSKNAGGKGQRLLALGDGKQRWQACYETCFVWDRLMQQKIVPNVMPVTLLIENTHRTEILALVCISPSPTFTASPLLTRSLHPRQPFPHISQVQMPPHPLSASSNSFFNTKLPLSQGPMRHLVLIWVAGVYVCVCVCVHVFSLQPYIYGGQDPYLIKRFLFLFFPPTTTPDLFPQVKHAWLLVGVTEYLSDEEMKE